jgi:hypothetical protein
MFHIGSRTAALVVVLRVSVRPLSSRLHATCSVGRWSRSTGWPGSCGPIQKTRRCFQLPAGTFRPDLQAIRP